MPLHNDEDSHTGRTSPGTSCDSNDTLQSIIKVVRYDCNGKQRELPVESGLFTQNSEPSRVHDGDAQFSSMERIVKNTNDFKSLAADSKAEGFKKKNLSDMALVKSSKNVSPQKHNQDLPVFSSTPPFPGESTITPNAKDKSQKSTKTRGDHIRIMKQYDVELLDSMMKGTPNKKSFATKKPGDARQEETEEQTSTQDEGNVSITSTSIAMRIMGDDKPSCFQRRHESHRYVHCWSDECHSS